MTSVGLRDTQDVLTAAMDGLPRLEQASGST